MTVARLPDILTTAAAASAMGISRYALRSWWLAERGLGPLSRCVLRTTARSTWWSTSRLIAAGYIQAPAQPAPAPTQMPPVWLASPPAGAWIAP